jgi:ribosomal-protein-alanine N-acetyltransferase
LLKPLERFETQRLVLRRPRLSDADDIFDNYAADPEVTRYLTWCPYNDRKDVRPFVQSRLARWDSGEEFSWVITLPEEERAIGMIGCRVHQIAADIGYALSRIGSVPQAISRRRLASVLSAFITAPRVGATCAGA